MKDGVRLIGGMTGAGQQLGGFARSAGELLVWHHRHRLRQQELLKTELNMPKQDSGCLWPQ